MRIHGVHLQGLRSPGGRAQFNLDPGYNAIVCGSSDQSAGLGTLLRALLFPHQELGPYADWIDPDAAAPARAGVALSLGGQAYRLIVDFPGERLLLGRYDRAAEGYERVSTDAAEIERYLCEAHMAPRDQFLPLYWHGRFQAHAPATDAGVEAERAGLERLLETAEQARRLQRELEPRRRQLEQARRRLRDLGRKQKEEIQELRARAALGMALDDLEEHVRRFEGTAEKRAAEDRASERARKQLLAERARLRLVPETQRSWMWLGLALGGAGGLAGALVHPAFNLAGLLGLALVSMALLVVRGSRRRVGAIEARLAALRVRERATERQFESEAGPVLELLEVLGLEGTEQLLEAAERYRMLLEQVERQKEELELARREFPESATAELQELEARLAEARSAPDPNELRARIAQLDHPDDEPPTLTQIDPGAASIGAAESAAARLAGRSIEEIRQLQSPVLPLYLGSLTHGAVSEVRSARGDWRVSGRGHPGEISITQLPADLRARVALALRLALLEGLAATRRFPFVLMADELSLDVEAETALARALRRLSAVSQVLVIASGGEPWVAAGAGRRVLSPGAEAPA